MEHGRHSPFKTYREPESSFAGKCFKKTLFRDTGETAPAISYLEACTTRQGGVIYSYSAANGDPTPGLARAPITAAAVCCSFGAGQYKTELAKTWIKYCKDRIRFEEEIHLKSDYQNYYYSQLLYVLGNDRYGEMFPNDDKKTWLTWTKYKTAMFPYLIESQDKTSGAWKSDGSIGQVFTTAVNLTILQLEKGLLPIYQR